MLAPPAVGAEPGRRRGPARRRTATVLLLVAGVVAGSLGLRYALQELAAPECELRAGSTAEQLTPEQTANAATIAMVALHRELEPHAVTVALATAIQESKLRNLNYGDADSLGLFQQRPSQGWGTPDQVRDPVFASTAFYDALEQVPDWQSGEVTVVAQAVQRSAYPDAYADHEEEGRVLATALTGQEAAAVGCRLDPVAGPGSASGLLAKAERQFGAVGTVTGSQVRFETADPVLAWATATWAVAHAEAESVLAVEVGGLTWRRDDGSAAWTGATGTEDPRSVTVTLAGG